MRVAKLTWSVFLTVVVVGANKVSAIPALQLYIEGATYDPGTETWVITQPEFTLWVVGNVGHFGTIYDVKLAAAVRSDEDGMITLTTVATISVGNEVVDLSQRLEPTSTNNFPSNDGAVPIMGDGRPLPTHGIYGSGVKFYEWSLGDFTKTDSPIGDFIYGFPNEFPSMGQINAYIVRVSGFSWVHFDAYGYIVMSNPGAKYVFAPFSHDAEHTPEPAFMLLLLAGSALLLRRKRQRDGSVALYK